MVTFAAAAFWTAVGMLGYAYAGFILLVALVGLLRRRAVRKAPLTPTVSFIVVAYNEARAIAARIHNILSLDYPRQQLQIIVASDGSTDGTDDVVRGFRAEGVVLLSLPRQGKIPALNEAVRHATGEILVFSDANIHCDAGALRGLTANFADPDVGGVAGDSSYAVAAGSESSSHGERMYWRYDTLIKALESDTGSVVSAHGGLYAIRKSLFEPIADASVTDDFAISTGVIARGRRLVFEPEARAVEYTTTEARREIRRRIRLMTRGLRGVWLRRRLLNPFRHGFYAIALFSHKVLRRLAPVWLLIAAAASAILAGTGHPLYVLAAAAQVLFYGLAALGWLLRRRRLGRLKPLCVPFYYCMANAASAIALVQFLRGKRISTWQPQRSI